MTDPMASRSSRVLRRIAIGVLVVIFLYPISYLALRGAGFLRPQQVFRNGIDEFGNWGQFHTTEVITGSPSEEREPFDRFMRRFYAPVAEFELRARGMK